MGSGLPDPATAPAAAASIPQTAFENKPPPGQRGPKGLSGRQTFSRVNTGIPPTPDAGQSQQKSMAPLGSEFLPKTAQLETHMTTTAMPRPTLHDFVKTAMEASAAKVDLSLESARRVASTGDVLPGAEKTASATPASASNEDVPSDYINKLAEALEYAAASMGSKTAAEETKGLGPGQGPGALETNKGKLPTEENIDTPQLGKAKEQPPVHPTTAKLPGQVKDPGGTMETNVGMKHPEQPVEPISNEKTSQLAYLNNLLATGLLKLAEDESGQLYLAPANEQVKVAMSADQVAAGLGGAATGAAKGTAVGAGGGALAGGLGGAVSGGLAGAAGGGLIGAGLGGLGGLAIGGPGGAAHGALMGGLGGAAVGGLGGAAMGGTSGAALGGSGGALLGGPVGAIRGGAQAARAQAAAEQAAAEQAAAAEMPKAASNQLVVRNLLAIGLLKHAEDAINPAQISAGKADATGAQPPAGAAPAGEEVPNEPSDVSAQKRKMLSSNEAAINYTKRDAKADSKSDVGDVVQEPAQSSSTDPVLNHAFAHTGEAGSKISSITRVAAARAVLSKLAEQMSDKKDEKKEKQSAGMAPSTPAEASGFSASSTSGG